MSHGESLRLVKEQLEELELTTLAAAALSGLLTGAPVSDTKPLDPTNVAAKDVAARAWEWALLMHRHKPNFAKVLSP